MPSFVDLTGQRFERLVLLERAPCHRVYWICRCDCGNIVTIRGDGITRGAVKSCGCLRDEGMQPRHGHTSKNGDSREYRSWRNMRSRCENPKATAYNCYGGRGITVCDRWKAFETFLADMGPRPAGTTLDRINNDGNYEPGNCRWADKETQTNNRRPRDAETN